MKNYVILLAAGLSSRFNSNKAKQFFKIDNVSLLEKNLSKFEKHSLIDEIILVINENLRAEYDEILQNNKFSKLKKIVNGGDTRQISSFNGVSEIPDSEAKILIHDVARPFVSDKIIDDLINGLDEKSALITAIPSTDTIYETNENQELSRIPNRKNLFMVQTPQAFLKSVILQAHTLAKQINKIDFTDDGGMVHYFNLTPIKIIEGEITNKKITFIEDIIS